jgi:putative DNA primase/helicase
MAQKIWNRSEPLRGTLSESYLMTRACELPPVDADLRHLRGDDRYPWPSLLGRVTDAITGEPLSLHFTRHDGRGKAPVERPKTLLRGHVKKDGVIRLWPDEAVTGGLCIAEGIETALTAAHAFTPVWGCVDAGNLAEFPVLEGIECLTIVADHDAAGIKSAEACAVRWARAHCEISVVLPETAGRDLNDEVAA